MNAYEIARAEATRVVEAAYRKAVAAGELPEGTIPPVAVETPKDSSNGDWASTFAKAAAHGAAQDRGEHRGKPRP